MNPFLLLIPVAALMCLGSAMSFLEPLRRHWTFIPGMFLLAGMNGGLFAWGAKLLDEKEKVYIFSLYFDLLMIFAYYFLPLLCFEAKPSIGILVGAALIVAGMTVIKVFG